MNSDADRFDATAEWILRLMEQAAREAHIAEVRDVDRSVRERKEEK